MDAERISRAFDQAIAFSKLPRRERIAKRPWFTLSRAFWSRVMALTKYAIPFSVSGETFWGKKVRLSIPDGSMVYQWGFIDGEPEINLAKYYIAHVKPGAVFFDIGSHFGYYALLADALGASVHAFEPTPRIFGFLRSSVRGTRVRANNCALWDKAGSMDFFDYGPRFGAFNSYLAKTPDTSVNAQTEHTKRKIAVPALTIDEYVAREQLGRVDFLQIDVERAETFVLKGAGKTIERFHPVIAVELFGKHWQDSDNAIIAVLKGYGYRLYVPDVRGALGVFNERDRDFIQKNIVAVYGTL